MLIPSIFCKRATSRPSLSRRVNANSQLARAGVINNTKLIKKGEC